MINSSILKQVISEFNAELVERTNRLSILDKLPQTIENIAERLEILKHMSTINTILKILITYYDKHFVIKPIK
tara:strand:- start:183 stop:401 length:219 start_codon:yes stop_codon:yes gene_type:complete